MHLPPPVPELAPCKICGTPAPFFGIADFNRACVEPGGERLPRPLYGFAIYYRRCPSCEFLFTDTFDAWSPADFRAHIYNDEYARLDPDFAQKRPAANAAFIAQLFGAQKDTLRLLDFGGGSGHLAACLRGLGFATCDTYDPFTPGFDTLPDGTYNLITCFETLEHAVDPDGCVKSIATRLAEYGVVVFSTLVQPADLDKLGMTWDYIGPRNGHISIQSNKSLALLWERHGFMLSSITDNVHMASRRDGGDRVQLGTPAPGGG
ncbi:MAG TPA: class I SAM-dependent methyltransferase [Xanthobacteraceae bacterium]